MTLIIDSVQAQVPRRAPNPPKPLALEKVEKLIERQHREADQDRNGYLTVEEVRGQINAMAEAIVRERFGRIDTDGNSAVSYAEFAAWQRSMGANALDDRAAASVSQAMVPNSLPFKITDRKYPRALRLLVPPLNVTMLSQADSNYDGQISVEELKVVQTKRFRELDENSDGFLILTELPTNTSRNRGGGRQRPPSDAPPPPRANGDNPQ
ncbi:MAG: EF-hand domain-containing protein [Pseudomonadota bacterium]